MNIIKNVEVVTRQNDSMPPSWERLYEEYPALNWVYGSVSEAEKQFPGTALSHCMELELQRSGRIICQGIAIENATFITSAYRFKLAAMAIPVAGRSFIVYVFIPLFV
jgi:hypothetical protein